jgi:hypothetical protein
MNAKRYISIVVLSGAVLMNVLSQTFNQPNYALKSHETMTIKKIEAGTEKTSIYLSVENRITGGQFCADKNIFIIYPDGTRSKLTSAAGIPACPDVYNFKSIGEKLDFVLTFLPLKNDIKWIDLIEDCSDNCFSFYSICLDDAINKQIDEASVLAENQESARALMSFIKIANTGNLKKSAIEGLIYMNIIQLSKETGNTLKAAEWYNKLKSSGIPHSDLYIKNLNLQGLKY